MTVSLPAESVPTESVRPARTAALPPYLQEVVDHAGGRVHRTDPVLPRTGGPSGNAQLTAWTGLLLLVLFVAELLTLVSVSSLVTWHVALGAALIPPALFKTATTGWRMVRYYAGSAHYKKAGPPPLLLRLLGPLVVGSTLALLGSGVALGLLGPDQAFRPLLGLGGFSVSLLTVHQAFFAVWAGATGLHVLARLVPALRTARPPRGTGAGTAAGTVAGTRHGRGLRVGALVAMTTLGALSAAALLSLTTSWQGFAGA